MGVIGTGSPGGNCGGFGNIVPSKGTDGRSAGQHLECRARFAALVAETFQLAAVQAVNRHARDRVVTEARALPPRGARATSTPPAQAPAALSDDSGVFDSCPVTLPVTHHDDNAEPIVLGSVQLVGTAKPGDSLTCSPEPSFTGDPSLIEYTATDGEGDRVPDPATVTLTDETPPDTSPDPEVFTGGR